MASRSVLLTLSLAFLAPAIVQAIVDSTLPRGIVLSQLFDLPANWSEQKAAMGLVAV